MPRFPLLSSLSSPLPLLLALVLAPAATAAPPPDFDTQIAPLLVSRCLDCHSGPKPKGDLDMTRKANVTAADLLRRVVDGEMPPKKPLPPEEVQLLKAWVDGGAKWGTDPIDPFRVTTATRAGYDWWSLRPVRRPAVPAVAGVRHPIDAFVQAKLRDKGLSLSPPADRRTLIRRLYFDLIGLPPSPEEVAAFESDPAPDAYERLVEKLLASPHYGERWARHWLDVVRYGETDGFERNTARPNAWHYRDWLIRALNADLPYDEFARLQLAGDVLRPNDPDAVRATGFLVASVHNTVLGNDLMRAIARQDELEDLVGSVGQTFLGLTTNCGRCHDHKFDPISQTDYYRLASALAGTGHGERPLPAPETEAEIARLKEQLDRLGRELVALEDTARAALLREKGLGRTGTASTTGPTPTAGPTPTTGPTPPAAPGSALALALAPAPVAAWDFRTGGEDRVGKLHAKPAGGVRLSAAGASFDGKTGLLRTPPLPFELRAKTLEAWVRLDTLTQRGGGVMSVQTPDGQEFDAIVFGEREPGRWMAGSDSFRRTQGFDGPEETEAANREVHIAVVYSADGTITGYRDGKPYGRGYSSKGPVVFAAGKAVVVFGCRHEPVGGNRMLAGTVTFARLYDTALSAEQVAASFAAGPGLVSEAELEQKLTPQQRTRRAALRKERDETAARLERLRAEAVSRKAYANVPQPPGVTRLLVRGDVTQPAAVVAPGGLAAIPGPKADFGLAPDAPDADRRRKLAEWVTDPANPLFARVVVNRLWHYHFGTGIVDTPSDFGFNGGRPSHPELLDWLAAELLDRKYSLKSLHRLIVTSATYQQGSAPRKEALAADADNRLLWRFKPHRLEGEAVRDAMLAVSGLLNREVGGKGFSDYRESNFNGTAFYDPFDPVGPEFHRRSVYRFVPRGANQGLLDAFDCPDPAAAAPRRAVTTTPLQALSLWNNGFALRVAAAFADRVAREAQGVDKQVARAWQLAYGRDPTPEETKQAVRLVNDHGLKALCRVLFNSNEFVTVE